MSAEQPLLRVAHREATPPDEQDQGSPMSVSGENAVDALCDLIESTGLVPSDRMDQVRTHAADGSVAEAIVDAGLAPIVVAKRHGLPYVDLAGIDIAQDVVEQLPFHILERACAIPYELKQGRLMVALADPSDVQTIDELRLATRDSLALAVASREDIEIQLRQFSRAQEAWQRAALVEDDALQAPEEPSEEELEAEDGVSDAPLVKLVNSIIIQAAEEGASDLHFEPQQDGFIVRQRVDGVLQEVQRLPRRLGPSILTRLKVLAKLDIAERRRPQDGRISLSARAAGRELDVRVAVLPSVEGEGCVMRLLDKSKKPPTLQEVGFSDDMRERIEVLTARPTGALFVTGPTGSGKSTTLYAALSKINRPDINIVTVEDPVEYRLVGVNQIQINHKAGLSFALALRTILRSDPDTIMVGEIRDAETAKISIEAALTGHFVLSTLHTNDAPAALTRLNEMGVEPFLTGSAVSAVLAQRLLRRLCVHCAEVYAPSEAELQAPREKYDVTIDHDATFHRKVGCARCNDTGYRGRVGIFQLMVMSDTLAHLASQRSSHDVLERAAIEEGMLTLWQDGYDKVAAALTTVEELHRVLV
ncbi:MAG: GspE/PulE family protein [Gaiellaceae bacterium]